MQQGNPVYKKKGERNINLETDQDKLVVVTEAKEGRVFYHQLNDDSVKLTSAFASFSQKFELCGYVN